jgi:glycosyltransferase involved in cell wall biosynthesis
MAVYNIGFVIEHVLGHITHAKNLQQNVPTDPEIRAAWGLLHFETPGLGGHIPLFKSNWTVRAGLRGRRAISRMARERRPDALFFHSHVPAILARDWMRRVPSIVSVDATPRQIDTLGRFYQHPQGPQFIERLKWQLNRDCFQAARHMVAWSNWAKQGLVDEYEVPADKVTVVPPGVNVRDWLRPAARRRQDGATKILFVGGDLERKGGHLLIEAFRALRPLGVELHLATREKVPAEPGLFVYNSMQPNSAELKALYHSCDIFALPTFGDCLPMVLSEAGAAGLAVVSTQLAAIPEVVRDGETGLLAPVGDTKALEEALRQLVLQPELRLRMGERAVAHVAREYDAQKNAGRLLDLLKGEVDLARMHTRVAA